MTGIRARTLNASLVAAGYDIADAKKEGPSTSDLPPAVQDEMMRVYRGLSGVLDDEDLSAGDWDFVCVDGLRIELDEFLHFNRYRAATMMVPWARRLPWADGYVDYCCGTLSGSVFKRAGAWATRRADAMFGGSDPRGVVGELGSSRWKQRAL